MGVSQERMDYVTKLVMGFAHRRDPRVRDYVMQSRPDLVLSLLGAYILLVGYGPKLMRNRPAPNLTFVMAAYNIVQVVLSAYMLREFVASRPEAGILCAPMTITHEVRPWRMLHACWLYHISKAVDFLDTVFLVLKKDFGRMSYLHVFHHASMYISYWLATLYTPGDPCWMGCALNCFVHCVMYSYYFLASLGPKVRRYLWWKRYLTQLQIIQFCILMVNIILLHAPGFRCGVPTWAMAMTFVYLVVLTGLFLNFYFRSYRTGRPAPPVEQKTQPKLQEASTEGSTVPQPEKRGFMGLAWYMLQRHGLGCYVKRD